MVALVSRTESIALDGEGEGFIIEFTDGSFTFVPAGQPVPESPVDKVVVATTAVSEGPSVEGSTTTFLSLASDADLARRGQTPGRKCGSKLSDATDNGVRGPNCRRKLLLRGSRRRAHANQSRLVETLVKAPGNK